MGNQISTFVSDAWNRTKEVVSNVTRQITGPVAQYVVKHPRRTLYHVFNLVLLIVPMTVATPVLFLLGWGAAGVRAGSLAAMIQSTMSGGIAAGSIFATLQSAAMGGYGVATVAGVTMAAAAASEGVAVAIDRASEPGSASHQGSSVQSTDRRLSDDSQSNPQDPVFLQDSTDVQIKD